MESKLPLTPVRSRTWHATPTEKVVIPATKRPATTLGIAHPTATTGTAVLRRPKTTSGITIKTLTGYLLLLNSQPRIMQFSFLIVSLGLGYYPLYLRLTLYGNECSKCRSA